MNTVRFPPTVQRPQRTQWQTGQAGLQRGGGGQFHLTHAKLLQIGQRGGRRSIGAAVCPDVFFLSRASTHDLVVDVRLAVFAGGFYQRGNVPIGIGESIAEETR